MLDICGCSVPKYENVQLVCISLQDPTEYIVHICNDDGCDLKFWHIKFQDYKIEQIFGNICIYIFNNHIYFFWVQVCAFYFFMFYFTRIGS